ncbi:MAG: membrane dipeptidase [Peptococcaceae bacterium]|nr:membrane dipeptidase [Peptococcaceae bacterium]
MPDGRAAIITKNSIIVDAHCDTLIPLCEGKERFREYRDKGHLDLPRLVRGGVKVQFFAAFASPRFRGRFLCRVLELIDTFYQNVQQDSNGKVVLVRNCDDIVHAVNNGCIAALLTVEGGEALEGSIRVLRVLYRLGVRGLGLTWNGRNELADGVDERFTGGSLTGFGVAVVQEMNRLGMLVDVAHLSETGFWKVMDVSVSPVIASHANTRHICDHPRNLSDNQIRALSRQGGVMGITFVPEFVHKDCPSLDALLDHIDHAVQLGGIGCVGLGSDFDGFSGRPAGIEDAAGYEKLVEGLLHRGYDEADIGKILGGNFLRVIREVLG